MPGLCSGGGRVLKFRFDWPIDGMGWKRDCNNFVQNTATSKGHLAIASIGHENKFHVCNISNRHQYGSTNHRDSPQDKNGKKNERKNEKKKREKKSFGTWLVTRTWLASRIWFVQQVNSLVTTMAGGSWKVVGFCLILNVVEIFQNTLVCGLDNGLALTPPSKWTYLQVLVPLTTTFLYIMKKVRNCCIWNKKINDTVTILITRRNIFVFIILLP